MSACLELRAGQQQQGRAGGEKPGLVSILCPSSGTPKTASFRRTLSADMPSKTWLAECGPKTTEFSGAESNFSEGHHIHGEKQSVQTEEKGQSDIWNAIMSQKAEEANSPLPPPYVHPLVKRSGSSLSDKSLEICTESLGSETGSDRLSSCPPSEGSDAEDCNKKDEQEEEEEEEEEKPLLQGGEKESQIFQSEAEEVRVVKYKIAPRRPLPPPLPTTLSHQVKSRRENGRLVLEAVSIPEKKYFHVQRENGRLRLTYVNPASVPDDDNDEGDEKQSNKKQSETEEVEEEQEETMLEEKLEEKDEGNELSGSEFEPESESEEEEQEEQEQEEEGEEEEEQRTVEMGIVRRPFPEASPGGLIKVHRAAITMKNLMGLANANPLWSSKFKDVVVDFDGEEAAMAKAVKPFTKPLLPRPRVARLIPSSPTAAPFNGYNYYRRTSEKTAAAETAVLNSVAQRRAPVKEKQNGRKGQRPLVILKGNRAECFVPLFRGCKEEPPKRSILIWQPYGIATSS